MYVFKLCLYSLEQRGFLPISEDELEACQGIKDATILVVNLSQSWIVEVLTYPFIHEGLHRRESKLSFDICLTSCPKKED